MKKRAFALTCLTVLSLAVAGSFLPIAARAQYELCDPRVLIDPGHGGTSLDTFPICSPSYNYGAPCWGNLCHEREVNLAVALRLGEILQSKGCVEGTNYYFTRKNDKKVCNIDRARLAESLMVQQFISIHHDGADDTLTNRTQMIRCSWDTTRSGTYRNSTPDLALKVGYKIRDTFNITYKDPLDDCGYTILRNTSMASVITEASMVSCPSEARRFTSGSGVLDEAEAIYEGLCCFVSNAGTAIVKNSYSTYITPNLGNVSVDQRWRDSPFVTAWGTGEGHKLSVGLETTFPDNWTRTFFRWVLWHDWSNKHDTVYNALWYLNDFSVQVPGAQYGYHTYLALYTGGPYVATISPPADTAWVGDTLLMVWSASPGADSTTAITIDLDRNGGTSGYTERFLPRDWLDNWTTGMVWYVNGPATSSARFRIKADDYAANSTVAYSAPFVVAQCGQLYLLNQTLATNQPAMTQLNLGYNATVAHELTLKVYRLDGTTWTLVSTPYVGTQFPAGHTAIQWPIDPAHQGVTATYRMVAACSTFCGSTGPVRNAQFSIDLAIVNHAPVLLQGPFLRGGGTCVAWSSGAEARVYALDEESGTNLTYYWHASRGTLPGGGHSATTSEPFVGYNAPEAPEGVCTNTPPSSYQAPPQYDSIGVDVTDGHGGWSGPATLLVCLCCGGKCPDPPACNCADIADVNSDGYVDVFDLIFLNSVIFGGGQQPLWIETCPKLRGDVDANGVLDVFDVIALVDIAFSGSVPVDPCTAP